jgi:hypothetical protein
MRKRIKIGEKAKMKTSKEIEEERNRGEKEEKNK